MTAQQPGSTQRQPPTRSRDTCSVTTDHRRRPRRRSAENCDEHLRLEIEIEATTPGTIHDTTLRREQVRVFLELLALASPSVQDEQTDTHR